MTLDTHKQAAILGAIIIAVTFGVVATISATTDVKVSVMNSDDKPAMSAHDGDPKIYDHPYGDLDEFRNATLSPYNDAIRNSFFIEHDFENDFHPGGDIIVGQVVALMIQKEKHAGTYDPTEAERRYHEFIMDFGDDYSIKPVVPDTAAGVDRALVDILGDAHHIHRAESLYESFNNNANIGHVHNDLFFADVDYWGLKFTMSACEYETPEVDCAAFPDIAAANRDLTDEEIEEVERMIDEMELDK